VDLDFVPKLQELEVGLECLRSGEAGVNGDGPQNSPEIRVRVCGLHVPQRFSIPRPDLFQVADVRADRVVRQPGRRPGEHETGKHIGLKPLDLLGACHGARLAEIPHDRQPHRASWPSTPVTDLSTAVTSAQQS
jgi:hypothetical protein